MKALVISDTHIHREDDIPKLREILEPFLADVDAIIHAGDSVSRVLVDFLKSIKPTFIVAGNMDSYELSDTLPARLIFDFGGHTIGLTHGGGQATGLKERVYAMFKDSGVEAIIFGHSHRPYIGETNGILMLNPGSPTDTRFADRNTIAILEAEDGGLRAEIIEV